MTQQSLNETDSAPTRIVQGKLSDTDAAGRRGKGNGHDEQARSGPQEVAGGVAGLDQELAALGLDAAQGATVGADAGGSLDDVVAGVAVSGAGLLTQIDLPMPRKPGSIPRFDAASFTTADKAQGLAGAGVQGTVIENYDGALMTKLLGATKDGKSIQEGGSPRTSRRARAIRFGLGQDVAKEMSALKAIRDQLKQHQSLALGQMQGTAPTRQVIFQDEWRGLSGAARDPLGSGPIYRGLDCLGYPDGEPGVLAFDIDTKDLPPALRQQVEQDGGNFAIMQRIDPQLCDTGYFKYPSASAGVRDTWSKFMRPKGAHHLLMVAEDGSDIPRYVKVMFLRLVLAGYGFIKVFKDGTMMLCCLVDLMASGRPERLWFAAPPVFYDAGHGQRLELVAGERQDEVRNGKRVDTRRLGDLTDAELVRLRAIVAGLKAAAQPEADQRQEEYIAARVARGIAEGLAPDVARGVALVAVSGGRLDPGGEFRFDDGQWRSGWEILADVTAIDGKTGADPLEPDYGGGHNKAIWFRKPGEPGVRVFSHAHGKRVFQLAYDAADWIELVQREIAGGVTPACLERLRTAGRHYLPTDAVQAHAVLRDAGVPSPVVLDFIDADELAPARIVAVVRANDRSTLAGLRAVAGVMFDRAWTDTRAQAELGLLEPADSDAIDWDAAEVAITAVVAGAAWDQTGDQATGETSEGRDTDTDTDPVTPTLPPPAPYPVEALPGRFGEAVAATARAYEVDASMAGTIGLAAVATAVGKRAPGVVVAGRLTPASLFTLEIADSSERKTSTDGEMFGGIRQVETELAEEYERAHQKYTWDKRVYEHAAKQLAAQKGAATKQQNAGMAGPAPNTPPPPTEPVPPKSPVITTADATVEGLRDLLATGHGLVGVISSEGASVLAGHSLGRAEGKSASAGSYSKMWDGLSDTIMRAGRAIRVKDPRVSMSLGVQPGVAARFLHDADLMDQGLPNRFLLTRPTRRSGTRTLATPTATDLAVLKRFQSQTADRLRQTLRIGTGAFAGPPRLTPLTLTPAAEAIRFAFAKEMEFAQAPGERFEFAQGMASKAAEQALRIALVLQLFENPDAAEVGETMMRTGAILARWYANEWLRVTSVPRIPRLNAIAAQALEWLLRNYQPAGEIFTARTLYRAEAGGVRSRPGADKVLSLLERTGHVERVGTVQSRLGRPPLAKWRLTAVAAKSPGIARP